MACSDLSYTTPASWDSGASTWDSASECVASIWDFAGWRVIETDLNGG